MNTVKEQLDYIVAQLEEAGFVKEGGYVEQVPEGRGLNAPAWPDRSKVDFYRTEPESKEMGARLSFTMCRGSSRDNLEAGPFSLEGASIKEMNNTCMQIGAEFIEGGNTGPYAEIQWRPLRSNQ